MQIEKMTSKNVWKVKLDKKVVGEIRYHNLVYQYFPKGGNSKNAGEEFSSLQAVIKSLES